MYSPSVFVLRLPFVCVRLLPTARRGRRGAGAAGGGGHRGHHLLPGGGHPLQYTGSLLRQQAAATQTQEATRWVVPSRVMRFFPSHPGLWFTLEHTALLIKHTLAHTTNSVQNLNTVMVVLWNDVCSGDGKIDDNCRVMSVSFHWECNSNTEHRINLSLSMSIYLPILRQIR